MTNNRQHPSDSSNMAHGSSARRKPLNGAFVGAVGGLGLLVIAVTVISAQAWSLRGEAQERLTRESAPAATLTSTPASTYTASLAARHTLIVQGGLTGWATTQPAAPISSSTAPVNVVSGLNRANVKAGMAAFQRLGCVACHTTDGHAGVGPSLYNVFGSRVDLADGGSVQADAAYIRESIRQPTATLHKGFQRVMPDFGIQIKDREIEAITEFLKSISPDPANRIESGPIAPRP